jgi:hypothetical protein
MHVLMHLLETMQLLHQEHSPTHHMLRQGQQCTLHVPQDIIKVKVAKTVVYHVVQEPSVWAGKCLAQYVSLAHIRMQKDP